jgi:hypothetical protein
MFHSIVQNGTLIADPNKDISATNFAFVTYAGSGVRDHHNQGAARFSDEQFQYPTPLDDDDRG